MTAARRLERLVRVRRAERDRERLACELLARSAETARRLRDTGRSALTAQAASLSTAARAGVAREWWRSAIGGLTNLGKSLEAANSAASEADTAHDAGRAKLLEASRRLRGAERLAENAQREARRAADRSAQKRLDDRAQHGATHKRAVLIAVALFVGVGPARAEEPVLPNPGVAMLIGEIQVRQAELDTREQELVDREERIADVESEIDVRLAELDTITTAVEERIANWERAHSDSQLSRLAKIYGSMDPRTAARLLEELDLDLATRIIAKMKHKQSAELLPLISQPRALAMSRSVAHPLGNPALPAEKSP